MIDETLNWNIAIDLIWTIQIFKTFATPYVKDVEIKDKCSAVAYKYITGFFLIDVLSTFLTLFTFYQKSEFLFAQLLRILYFPRALDILKSVIEPIVTFFNIRKQTRNTILSLVAIIYILCAIMHMIACVWVYLGETEGEHSWKVITSNMSEE